MGLADAQPRSSDLFADLAQLTLEPPTRTALPPTAPPASQVASLLRVAGAVDPLAASAPTVATLLQLGSAAAASGNLKLGARILARAQQSPLVQNSPAVQHRLALDSLALPHEQGRAGEASLRLAALAQEELAGGRGCAACLQLAGWLAQDGAGGSGDLALDLSGVRLEEYSPICTGLQEPERMQLALLVSASRLAPLLAAAWAALANWLHSRLEGKDQVRHVDSQLHTSHGQSLELIDSDWTTQDEVLRSLAIRASCQRLMTTCVPHHQLDIAAPELLRVLKLLEEGCDQIAMNHIKHVQPLWWEAVVPQLFSQLTNPKVCRCPVQSRIQDKGELQGNCVFLQEHMHALARELLQVLEEVAPASVLYPALAERNSGAGTLPSISETA